MTTRIKDVLALLILLALWLLFFWRLFTPIEADQASLTQGDFSGQFVAFAGYQYARFSQGEIPLWNPYNNGGLPFIADTQAAVFYPPRLLTIALSSLTGGWTYHALELEMAFHVLFYSILLYVLIRRITLGQQGSMIGGLIAALAGSYGGFLTGYPQLQLAILEAGIWLPLAMLGIVEAARQPVIRWRWLLWTGVALGLSWMAGHPQTSWFLSFLVIAYLLHQFIARHYHWTSLLRGLLLIGMVSGGMAAVQLLPGLEYLPLTARSDLGYDAKGNGFPFKDLLQLLFPGQISLYSPLYFGVSALALLLILVWRWREIPQSLFWATIVLVSIALSFGANSALFAALYNILPGLRYFRGQERAAYLVANGLAILTGLTAVRLVNKKAEAETLRNIRRALIGLIAACSVGIALAHTGWLSERVDESLNVAVFSTILVVAAYVILRHILQEPQSQLFICLLVALVAFELFSVNMDANLDPVPPQRQIDMTPSPLVAQVLDTDHQPYRVDGFRGLGENYGSLYGIMDMRGISPLFLNGPFQLIEPDKINPLAWELFAVRYVFSDWTELPVPSQVLASGEDRFGAVNLHQLEDPRPFAQLIYDAELIDSDAFTHELLRHPDFNPREVVILDRDPGIELSGSRSESASVEVTQFVPERIVFHVNTPENAILSLAQVQYPGWQAWMNGDPTSILRAYGALSAVAVPAGEHEIVLLFAPFSYQAGAVLSLLTWLSMAILAALWMINRRTL